MTRRLLLLISTLLLCDAGRWLRQVVARGREPAPVPAREQALVIAARGWDKALRER